jgi:hypothetical protein
MCTYYIVLCYENAMPKWKTLRSEIKYKEFIMAQISQCGKSWKLFWLEKIVEILCS